MKKETLKLTCLTSTIFIATLFFTSCSSDDKNSASQANKKALAAEITTVTGLVSSSSEGNAVGNYVLNSIASLKTVLAAAKNVENDESSSQVSVNKVLGDLEDARFAFEAKKIDDVAIQFSANGAELSSAVEQSSNSAAIFNLSKFTFETWVYYTAKPGFFGQIASTEFYSGGVWGWNVRIGDGDVLDFAIADDLGESRLQPSATDLPAAIVPKNKWVHIACVFDGSTMKSYINGVLLGSIDASARTKMNQVSAQKGAFPLTFGNSAGFIQPERRLVGKMFDVRYWSVARTADQIKASKDFILTGNEEGLVAYWPFIKPASTETIADFSKETVIGTNNLLLKSGAVVNTRN